MHSHPAAGPNPPGRPSALPGFSGVGGGLAGPAGSGPGLRRDSIADTDMNVVMTDGGGLIEVQGTAEGATFSRDTLNGMLDLALAGGQAITAKQREALSV